MIWSETHVGLIKYYFVVSCLYVHLAVVQSAIWFWHVLCFFSFSHCSSAGKEAISYPPITQHYILGRIHQCWQWKVGVSIIWANLRYNLWAFQFTYTFDQSWHWIYCSGWSRVISVVHEKRNIFLLQQQQRALHFRREYSDSVFASPLRAPHLGRELVCKESKKNFKATIAMSQDFPLGIESWVYSLNLASIQQIFLHLILLLTGPFLPLFSFLQKKWYSFVFVLF